MKYQLVQTVPCLDLAATVTRGTRLVTDLDHMTIHTSPAGVCTAQVLIAKGPCMVREECTDKGACILRIHFTKPRCPDNRLP